MEDRISLGKQLTVHYSAIMAATIMEYCPIFSFATVFLLDRGFSNSEVGLTLTISNIVALIFLPFATSFADKTKRFSLRSLTAISMGVVAFFSLMLFFTPAIVLPTAVLFVLLTIVFSIQSTFVTSLSMEHINNGVPVNFSLARGIGSLSFAALSYLLGFLVKDLGASVVMLFNIGLGILGIGLVLTFRKAIKIKTGTHENEADAAGLVEFAKRNLRFLAVVFSIALMYFSHVTINTYLIRIFERVGGDSADMGLALSIAAFLELPAMALFPMVYRKIGNASVLLKFAGASFILKAIVTLLAPNVLWLDLSMILQFFGYAVLTPASVFYVNEKIHDKDKNKGQGLMMGAMGIGGILGNWLGGVMLDIPGGGVHLMLLVGIFVSLAGLVMLVLVDQKRKK